jgi:hypothetical protein
MKSWKSRALKRGPRALDSGRSSSSLGAVECDAWPGARNVALDFLLGHRLGQDDILAQHAAGVVGRQASQVQLGIEERARLRA